MNARERNDRNRLAAELHLAGMSISDIAPKIGLKSKASVHAAVKAGLDLLGDLPADISTSINPALAEALRSEIARIESVVKAQWDKACEGNGPAADRVVKYGEQRIKLLAMLIAPAAPVRSGREEKESSGVALIIEQRARRRAEASHSASA